MHQCLRHESHVTVPSGCVCARVEMKIIMFPTSIGAARCAARKRKKRNSPCATMRTAAFVLPDWTNYAPKYVPLTGKSGTRFEGPCSVLRIFLPDAMQAAPPPSFAHWRRISDFTHCNLNKEIDTKLSRPHGPNNSKLGQFWLKCNWGSTNFVFKKWCNFDQNNFSFYNIIFIIYYQPKL